MCCCLEPQLADDGVYLASESTFYRVLKAHNQHHRRGARPGTTPSHAADQLYRNERPTKCSGEHFLAPTLHGTWPEIGQRPKPLATSLGCPPSFARRTANRKITAPRKLSSRQEPFLASVGPGSSVCSLPSSSSLPIRGKLVFSVNC